MVFAFSNLCSPLKLSNSICKRRDQGFKMKADIVVLMFCVKFFWEGMSEVFEPTIKVI